MDKSMTYLTPFYGLSKRGNAIAKVLNRILLIAELAAVGYGAWYHLACIVFNPFWIILYFIAAIFLLSIINKILRSLWNLLLAIFYGTSDPDEIGRVIVSREEKSANRKAGRAQIRDSRSDKRKEKKPSYFQRKKEERLRKQRVQEFLDGLCPPPPRRY